MNKVKHIMSSLYERLGKDEYMASAKEAVEYFNTNLKDVFNNDIFHIEAKIINGLGTSINFDVTRTEEKSKVIVGRQYSLSFMCYLDPYQGFNPPKNADKFSIEAIGTYSLKYMGLKYRVISGESPLEVTKKLVDWLKKNKDTIEKAE